MELDNCYSFGDLCGCFLVVNGYYIIPFINVGIGILLGKIFKKKECYLIILCIILIICGQVLFDYKYITPMKEYDEVINTCYDINEKWMLTCFMWEKILI